jgi:hypothetical protein
LIQSGFGLKASYPFFVFAAAADLRLPPDAAAVRAVDRAARRGRPAGWSRALSHSMILGEKARWHLELT